SPGALLPRSSPLTVAGAASAFHRLPIERDVTLTPGRVHDRGTAGRQKGCQEAWLGALRPASVLRAPRGVGPRVLAAVKRASSGVDVWPTASASNAVISRG